MHINNKQNLLEHLTIIFINMTIFSYCQETTPTMLMRQSAKCAKWVISLRLAMPSVFLVKQAAIVGMYHFLQVQVLQQSMIFWHRFSILPCLEPDFCVIQCFLDQQQLITDKDLTFSSRLIFHHSRLSKKIFNDTIHNVISLNVVYHSCINFTLSTLSFIFLPTPAASPFLEI